MARHKLPVNIKREAIYGRIDPKVNEFLRALGEPNMGRAVDRAVTMLMEKDSPDKSDIKAA
jgi:hypothetical protein